MTDPSEDLDGEVLRLRVGGRSFTRISRELKLDKGADAQRAFQRALQRLPVGERARVHKDESSCLDRLEQHVNDDPNGSDADRSRRLAAIERLRSLLTAAPS